jgi:replicative DNA helicase
MSKTEFGYGLQFQQALLKTIIEDRKYGINITPDLKTEYFDGVYFRYLFAHIQEFYTLYETVPDYETLTQKIISENQIEKVKIPLDTLDGIRKYELVSDVFIKNTVANFIKKQQYKKLFDEGKEIFDKDDIDGLEYIKERFEKIMKVGVVEEEMEDVFDDLENAIMLDKRDPIPTGITKLDEKLNGGLAKGEFGLIIAPTGIGKTTYLTKVANNGYVEGNHVIHMFFEDNKKEIKRKHYTIWSGVASNEQVDYSTTVLDRVREVQSRTEGSLTLCKLPSDGVTVSAIKNKIKKHLAEGKKLDLLIIDYVDCISPEKNAYNEEWKGDGAIMRKIESLCSEFNIAIWVATQGNRSSLNAEFVQLDQVGGSIKKTQIAHVVISIARSPDQKQMNLANLFIMKSRVGFDGIRFENIRFNNRYLIIDSESDVNEVPLTENTLNDEEKRVALIRENLSNAPSLPTGPTFIE